MEILPRSARVKPATNNGSRVKTKEIIDTRRVLNITGSLLRMVESSPTTHHSNIGSRRSVFEIRRTYLSASRTSISAIFETNRPPALSPGTTIRAKPSSTSDFPPVSYATMI